MYAHQEASGLRLSVNGNTCVFTKEYDPACLDTDVAGKLARRVVADGARVKQGEVRFVLLRISGEGGGTYSLSCLAVVCQTANPRSCTMPGRSTSA